MAADYLVNKLLSSQQACLSRWIIHKRHPSARSTSPLHCMATASGDVGKTTSCTQRATRPNVRCQVAQFNQQWARIFHSNQQTMSIPEWFQACHARRWTLAPVPRPAACCLCELPQHWQSPCWPGWHWQSGSDPVDGWAHAA